MILECDVGNTRCKWRLLQGEKLVAGGALAHSDLNYCWSDLSAVERVRLVSVAKKEVLAALLASLQCIDVEPELAVVASTAGLVKCAYDEPAKLGVDRWAAVVAAYHYRGSAALVFDAGSALTADLVDNNGCHLGGYIVPGVSLMKTSLLSDTGGVRFDPCDESVSLSFGKSTGDGVSAGVLASQIGVISVAIEEAKRQIGEDFAILLTGGDAELLLASLPIEISERVEWIPGLVLDGLKYLLP